MQIKTAPAGAGPIGLLYPGEMGTAVANLLCHDGHRIVTTLDGRGASTARNCRATGLEELEDLQAVVDAASMLLVLVPPGAAERVAAQVREKLSRPRGDGRLLYVDLNSAAPETARACAAMFAGTCVDFVDGAISGPASRLANGCVLYLSGARAGEVAALFEEKLPVQVLGDKPGSASALRMLLSGLTKGVLALFVEMALAARQAGILDRLLAAFRAAYPGIMDLVERMLPTYSRHAARRGQEMIEVEKTIADLGLRPTVVPGIRELTMALGTCWAAGGPAQDRSVRALVEDLHARRLLRRDPDADLH